LCYVALTNNILGNEVGSAMISGREIIEAASATEEMDLSSIDLERVRWLSSRDDSIKKPKSFK